MLENVKMDGQVPFRSFFTRMSVQHHIERTPETEPCVFKIENLSETSDSKQILIILENIFLFHK